MPRPKLVDKDGRFLVPVVIDTREQQPYPFEGFTCDQADGGGPLTVPTVTGTLASGDYSLLGYETRVAIEKKSLSDLYGTLGQGRDRFERELERLAAFDFAAVVVEATWQQICAEPPEYTQLAPKTVFRSVLAWSVRYPRVHWFPCGPRRLAEVTTFRLLERWLKEELANGGNVVASLGAGECKTAIQVAAHKLHETYQGARWFQMVGVGNNELVIYCREKSPDRDRPEKSWYGYPVRVVVIGEIRTAGGCG